MTMMSFASTHRKSRNAYDKCIDTDVEERAEECDGQRDDPEDQQPENEPQWIAHVCRMCRNSLFSLSFRLATQLQEIRNESDSLKDWNGGLQDE